MAATMKTAAMAILCAFAALDTCGLCQAPPTIKQALSKLGISTDRTSLYAALRDHRPAARGIAAAELAEMRDYGAVQQIESLLPYEHDKEVRFTFDQSLNILGSQAGTSALEGYCADTTEDVEYRIRASDDLAVTGDYKCISAAADYLTSKDGTIQLWALLYLSKVPAQQLNVPKGLGPNLLSIAKDGSSENLRNLAGKAIMRVGDEGTKSAYLASHPNR
jgi:hypothetical protein